MEIKYTVKWKSKQVWEKTRPSNIRTWRCRNNAAVSANTLGLCGVGGGQKCPAFTLSGDWCWRGSEVAESVERNSQSAKAPRSEFMAEIFLENCCCLKNGCIHCTDAAWQHSNSRPRRQHHNFTSEQAGIRSLVRSFIISFSLGFVRLQVSELVQLRNHFSAPGLPRRR